MDGLVRGTSPSRLNQRTTHVEALIVGQQDGGSIPPASMSRQVSHLTTLFGPQRHKVTQGKALRQRTFPLCAARQ